VSFGTEQPKLYCDNATQHAIQACCACVLTANAAVCKDRGSAAGRAAELAASHAAITVWVQHNNQSNPARIQHAAIHHTPCQGGLTHQRWCSTGSCCRLTTQSWSQLAGDPTQNLSSQQQRQDVVQHNFP
jgi:hypothetical protein